MDVIFILKGYLFNIIILVVYYYLVYLVLYCCNLDMGFFFKGIN